MARVDLSFNFGANKKPKSKKGKKGKGNTSSAWRAYTSGKKR
jgi:hypothetical protein